MKKLIFIFLTLSCLTVNGQVTSIIRKANIDPNQDIININTIVNYILEINQNIDLKSVDLNSDNKVDVADITTFYSSLLYQSYFEKAINGIEYVDLGLKNSENKTIYWAKYNIGASEETEFGNYYAWGDREPQKSSYTSDTYNPVYQDEDIANLILGGDWRLPMKEEIQLLIDNCDWTPITDGTIGYRITSRINGNSIFLPAAKMYNGSNLYVSDTKKEGCYYWTSTKVSDSKAAYLAAYPITHSNYPPSVGDNNISDFYFGRTIRPVCVVNIPYSISIPIFNGDGDEEADPDLDVLAPKREAAGGFEE